MAVSLSTADAAIIEHTVPLDASATAATAAHSGRDIAELYDVKSTAHALIYGPDGEKITPPLARVALQFPDEALIDSVPVFRALEAELKELVGDSSPRLYILADTSYGSCCVDEVAAQHVGAEAVVHYGHACLSATARLPALYTFAKHPVDVQNATDGLLSAAAQLQLEHIKAVVLTYDMAYTHAASEIYSSLASKWPYDTPLLLSRVDTKHNYDDKLLLRAGQPLEHGKKPPTGRGRAVDLPTGVMPEDTATLYLGGESRALTHLLLTLGAAYPLASYDPATQRARVETGQTNRLLMRRYAAIQKARDASVVGLVIGTLGIASYLPLLQHLRKLLTSPISRRKVYTISVGKLNPAKLANFQEIDVFVLVACPENSLIDTRDFQKPIVTPWEMLLAVQAHGGREVAWTGAYELDFAQVAQGAQDTDTTPDDDEDERPHFSFATGGYVARTHYGDGPDDDNRDASAGALELATAEPHQVVARDASGTLTKVLDSAARAHLGTRSWTGLDDAEGTGSAAVLEQGMAGMALHYRSAAGAPEDSVRYDTSPPALVLSKRATLVPREDMSLDTSFASPDESVLTAKPSDTLFLGSDDEQERSPVNVRERRMQVLKALARGRAPTQPAPQDAPVLSDVSEPESDPDDELDKLPAPAAATQAPRVKPLSKREQLEMHRMTAQLRRAQRTTIERAEPKRYQLSELLSTIEHAKRSPNERRLMHSSDPIESSSTPSERRTSPYNLMPPNMDPDGDVFVDAPSPSASRQRKARLLQRQRPVVDSDDEDLVVEPARSLHARMRAPSEPPEVSDAQLDASAHTFALAADHAARVVPTSPVRSASASPARPRVRHSPRVAPVLMNMEQFNATLLRKTQEQNAARNARRPRQEPLSPRSDGSSEKENIPLPRPADDGDADGDVFNDDGDLGRFFVPTQAPEHVAAESGDPPAATLGSHQSESSVLAQFFVSTQDGQPRGASLDLFSNQRRDGPVGGTARRLESVVRGDAFAALREREQVDAEQLLSPVDLPSLDPSLAQEALRAAASERRSDTLYLNQDGFFTQTKPGATSSRGQWLLPSQMDDFAQPTGQPVSDGEDARERQAGAPLAADSDVESEQAPENDSDIESAAGLQEADSDAETDAIEAGSGAEDAPQPPQPRRARSNAFVFGEAEESDEEDRVRDDAHGGLAGIFSDKEASEGEEEDSDDDADLESLLDDERDEDEETKDILAHKRYMQHREEDDAAVQALHERAAKGMLRSRRRGRIDGLGEMLDDDADEDELRRRLRAPRFQTKRRRIDGDEMDVLAAREDTQAFVRQYTETHTSADDYAKYEFLDEAPSSDEEAPRTTVTARELREELLRHRLEEREQTPQLRSDDEDAPVALREASKTSARASEAVHDDDEHARLLFNAHRLDPDALSNEQKARREMLLAEFSNEPEWRQVRGGNAGLDRRRSGNKARARAETAAPAPETRAEPRRLVGSLLQRKFAS
ncbi:Diphthamide biosynthesis protein 2 [Malassezia cuniculi]|uniref:Diphthamide biosynthesis protein 2 n=1 Tax=Malassezia cuniculi TaxID=948313 RepID=A0AAF0ETH7_9BASI|nr:Diphthamide biosynthesis protein 2 [Malassezia cuniculi]